MSENNQQMIYEFKRTLEDIQNFKGRATEMISLYVPPSKRISDVMSYLREEFAQSSNIKSKSTMKNVTSAIESLMSRLKVYKSVPENGLVFFVGHVITGNNQTSMMAKIIEPPEQVPTFIYRCDSSFYIEPLERMMDVKEVYGLIVIDRKEATIGFLKGKSVISVKNMQSMVPSKHGRGGQSARRFERLIEIAADEYFKKVGDICTEVFLDVKNLRGILIGGPGSTKEFFAEKDYLHHELKKKIVVPYFDTGYTDEFGLKELVENAGKVLTDLGLVKEKKLINRLMKEVTKTSGKSLATYGEDEVRKALSMGAVDKLLLSEGLRMKRITYECSNCGEKTTITVHGRNPNTEIKCKSCSYPMSFSEEEDIVKELIRIASETGSSVEIISTESEEGKRFLDAFSGIAALLRFIIS